MARLHLYLPCILKASHAGFTICSDEASRADRSPGEFYQLDIEMSFVTQDDVFEAVEPVLRGVFEEFGGGKSVTPKFPKIKYADAMRQYGSDKPDLRNPILMQNVTEAFAGSGFKVFAGMIANDPTVEIWAIPAPGGGNDFLALVEPAREPAREEIFAWCARGLSMGAEYARVGTFMAQAGVQMTHVPYKGTGPALNDLAAKVAGAKLDVRQD